MQLVNKAMLITYPDSLGKNLHELAEILNNDFTQALGGVHLLPFFPSSGDRGFAPKTYKRVDEQFGTWEDVKQLSHNFYLMADLMINHLSRESVAFQDYLQKGEASPYAQMFIDWERFWPAKRPTPTDVAQIYKRKDKAPYQLVTLADGTQRKVWNTFGDEQIDLDVTAPITKDFLKSSMKALSHNGISIVRLDAFAYAVKKIGSNDFFVEPEIWQLLQWLAEMAKRNNMVVLPEIHEHYRYPLTVSEHGYFIYDFALPMLVLHTLYAKKAAALLKWMERSPMKQFTTLDTHDGIGVVDVKDILNDEEIGYTTEQLYQRGSNVKRIYSSAAYNNLDIYQINTTYYSALGEDDAAYLLARALQVFAPGIPQIYYVGLLAGKNDLELLEKTKEGRNINRHYYSQTEIQANLTRPIVQKLLALLRFRNQSAAFDLAGSLKTEMTDERHFTVERSNQERTTTAILKVDLTDNTFAIWENDQLVEL